MSKAKKKKKKNRQPQNKASSPALSLLPFFDKKILATAFPRSIETDVAENELLFLDDHVPAKEESTPVKLKGILTTCILLAVLSGYLVKNELLHSQYQAKYFHGLSSSIKKEVLPGSSEVLQSPNGPFDQRLGYARANEFRAALLKNNFKQTHYTKVSPQAVELSRFGINFPYEEKSKAGISIINEKNELLYTFSEPSWVFEDFDAISKLIVDTLLFIEDRTILQTQYPQKNPALEWDRFIKATLDLLTSKVIGDRNVPGGSTLATQIEKYKHSDGGRTAAPLDKLRQMYSASLRAYHTSLDTRAARKDIVLEYINSVPLAAVRGYGEVHGLGDGLWAYYGEDPEKINEILSSSVSSSDEEKLKIKAEAYRKVLSLFLAHRRPSDYLDSSPHDLQLQVDKYLPLLFSEGIIQYDLFKATLSVDAQHRNVLPHPTLPAAFSSRKGPNVVRTHLMNYLGITSLYELDRLDLQVTSTINVKVQDEVSRLLLRLRNRDEIRKLGLDGFRLLSTDADPKKVIYSFTLFENNNGYNKLRVQTDTFDQPLNINEGVKLDLGSTAKFRTIVTYLEVVEEIYKRYYGMTKVDLVKAEKAEKDPLSVWAISILKNNPEIDLPQFLEHALDRQYSANPGERFFTAGGVHTFSNFNADDNAKVLSIRHALRHSVNLPFIRLMRDLVKYFSFHTEGSSALTLSNMSEDKRSHYLKKFADQEGKVFIRRFYEKYQNKTEDQIITALLETAKHIPKRFAGIYWFLNPDASIEEFIAFMKKHVDHAALSEKELQKYYTWYSTAAKTLGDKGYVARMHPLELWVAAYVMRNPKASLSEVIDSSYNQRIEVYDWLMKTSRRHAQDKRIQILLEAEAFQELYQRWKKVGYPLSSIVPSYATALGTSADRPDALAELMGIINNNGLRYKKSSIDKIKFAKDTPYEMGFSFQPQDAERVLSPEVVHASRPLLLDIVKEGTAIRLKEGIKIGDITYPVGGKTGTGDHRYQVYGKGGGLLEKRVVNRTATFMFVIGDKYHGVLTAFVPGREAARFKFTSALPVQILKILSPALRDLES